MRVIVCGGRDFRDKAFVHQRLDEFHEATPITELIEGGAKGVDNHALRWANAMGIKVITVHADWGAHGKSAGPIRNAEMLKLKPDMVIAFPGGKGTANMVALATAAGVPVTCYKQ